MLQGDAQKWKRVREKHGQWNTKKARKVQRQEAVVIIEWLKDLKLPSYTILEIGCGNGYVGQLVIEALLKEDVPVIYTFTDLLPECLDIAKKNTAQLQQDANISFELLDVYHAHTALGEGSQSIIVSTGFASAATYREAVPAVSKLLKKDGVLIADFVNHLAPLIFLRHLPRSAIDLARALLRLSTTSYHFGIIGIDRFFRSYQLEKTAAETVTKRRNPLLCMFRKV